MSLNELHDALRNSLLPVARHLDRLIDNQQIIVVMADTRKFIVRHPVNGLCHAIRQGIIGVCYAYLLDPSSTSQHLTEVMLVTAGQFMKSSGCVPDNRRDINIIRDLYQLVLGTRPDDNPYIQSVFRDNNDQLDSIINVSKIIETRHTIHDRDNISLRHIRDQPHISKLLDLSNVLLFACGDKNPTLDREIYLPRYGILSNSPDELVTALSLALRSNLV